MADFPTTELISLFPGPAENPLSEAGAWQELTPERDPLRKNAGAPNGTVTDSVHGLPNYSVYVRESFNSDAPVEVWGCTTGGQLGAALETWRVFLAYTIGPLWSGYLLYFGGALSKAFFIGRYANGSLVEEVASNGAGYPDKMGLRINGDEIEAWGEYGAVWSLQCSGTDTTYRGDFYLGLGIEDPTVGGLGFSCFGGGKRNRPHIYRVLRA